MCVEETIHGEILQVEEWKCMYAPKPKVIQTCNLFDCPKWVAMEWSQVSLKSSLELYSCFLKKTSSLVLFLSTGLLKKYTPAGVVHSTY